MFFNLYPPNDTRTLPHPQGLAVPNLLPLEYRKHEFTSNSDLLAQLDLAKLSTTP